MYKKCGNLDVSQPHEPQQPVTGTALLFTYFFNRFPTTVGFRMIFCRLVFSDYHRSACQFSFLHISSAISLPTEAINDKQAYNEAEHDLPEYGDEVTEGNQWVKSIAATDTSKLCGHDDQTILLSMCELESNMYLLWQQVGSYALRGLLRFSVNFPANRCDRKTRE
jgi:hypothetical protein